MRNVPSLFWREIIATFFTPLAYIVLTVFLFFSGFFFYWVAADSLRASFTDFSGVLTFLFLVATPFLTMRLLSDEYRSGTIETMMTAPVTDTEIVLAKFLGAMAFFTLMLLSTLAYVGVLAALGDPEAGPIVAAYVGLFLMGAQFVALGVFCSALSSSQVVAGVLALVLQLIIWVLGTAGAVMVGPFAPILAYAGTLPHMDVFANGRIAFRDAFYFVSFTCFWLFLAVRALESKRWR